MPLSVVPNVQTIVLKDLIIRKKYSLNSLLYEYGYTNYFRFLVDIILTGGKTWTRQLEISIWHFSGEKKDI